MASMIRTQIYLPAELHEALRLRGEASGKSMAEQVREAIVAYLAREGGTELLLREDDPIWDIVGAGEGPKDSSEDHDRYIYGRSIDGRHGEAK